MLQSSYKLTHKNFQSEFELDNDLAFFNTHYPFPNDLQVYNQYKSFKTIFEFNGSELPEHYTKKLSMLNRIHYTIKLKQIKREQITPDSESTHFIRYLLYYEPVPYSLAFARQNCHSLAPSKLQKILYQTVKDLIDLNIYCELTASYCGFTENGEFRIFVPPFSVLSERKLYTTDKQAIMSSADRIVRFWQAQTQKPREVALADVVARSSYRFNSPQPKKEHHQHRKSEDDHIDVKKTIKLPKNYQNHQNQNNQNNHNQHSQHSQHQQGQNQANQQNWHNESNETKGGQAQAEGGKLYELKKHKSMQTFQSDDSLLPKKQDKKGYEYLHKINELNKKITAIRSAVKIKKDSLQQLSKEPLHPQPHLAFSQAQLSRPQSHLPHTTKHFPLNYPNTTTFFSNANQFQQQNEGEVIFDKYRDFSPQVRRESNTLSKAPLQAIPSRKESIDSQEQEMGYFNGMSLQANAKLRRTAQPVLQKLRNTEGKYSQSTWHHESAGNRVLKRIIQKNKEICPQIFEAREHTSVSKNSMGRSKHSLPRSKNSVTPLQQAELQLGSKGGQKGRLKKMVSLDNFESQVETRSINLSEFSKDLSNVRRRREKEQRNKEMKEKVQQILLKSKKAIELLKNTNKPTK